MLTSPSKFLTGTIFLHAHLQTVYYNYVKLHLNPMSRFRRSCAYKPLSPYRTYICISRVQVKLFPLPNFGQQPYSFMHICR